MRISDWSSDVCASDLAPSGRRMASMASCWVSSKSGLAGLEGDFFPAQTPCLCHPFIAQIGRASCRESVCQYVYISVVAVEFIKILPTYLTFQSLHFTHKIDLPHSHVRNIS